MKILNLYAGIGGNRKLWGDEHEITAVENNQDIIKVYNHYFPKDLILNTDAHQYLLENYESFDFVWSSPPCQTHSRARLWGWRNDPRVEKKYPDMSLYQEIIFLRNFYDGLWVVENVKPYYDLLIQPDIIIGRHVFWCNFNIIYKPLREADINRGTREDYSELHGFDLSKFKINNRKDQIYRNCVHPETGLHILQCAVGIQKEKNTQLKLFN